ncbi:hypothetical protein CkaCkLH20_09382 [Colletotrichum karsti]|uniref:BZIP domain-containing protein n=1 Tax=Colletotrichum karsti TaxID=1095194 RepID=A0A9P6HZC6_9PEZI|nr:uncharacterized protein CkaCkLH20_09382 [Colletotrichum karsti]KAF9873219.1 hypothetical protein CkaCkLH20_09382 [Colletotrichum karsti]
MSPYFQDSDLDYYIAKNNLNGFYQQPFDPSTTTQAEMSSSRQMGGYIPVTDTDLLMSPPMSEENATPFLNPDDASRYEHAFQAPIPEDRFQYQTFTADQSTEPVYTSLDPVIRSTTPELEPPFTAQLSSTNLNGAYLVRGGFASKLASALTIPSTLTPIERFDREQTMFKTLDPHTDHPLPPPSPTIKNFVQPDTAVEEAHRIRQKPARVTIPALPPKFNFEGYQNPAGMPEGPDKDAVIARNNVLSALKSANDKLRNNTAAARSRDRKKRAIVHRAEAICELRAELAFWKACAVGLGAGVGDWKDLDGNVKREMVADRRFDAFDFTYDVEGEERVAELAEKVAHKAPGKKRAQKKKRKAEETEEMEE